MIKSLLRTPPRSCAAPPATTEAVIADDRLFNVAVYALAVLALSVLVTVAALGAALL